jgi:ribonucleoside-diphosphate reductase alpha chain
MGVLRVDHPDIEEFIEAKCNTHRLTNFNISVAITDEFMEAVKADAMFQLRWGGSDNYPMVRATALWDKIMRATWDWAEPGVLFIDRINRKNNLWYCESIAATNPCGEQPLPPHGACLLGSFNLTQFISDSDKYGKVFNIEKFKNTIPDVVRAMDNVVDAAVYPLTEQYESARDKRRMGLGITGLANTAEVLGAPYGSTDMLEFTALVMSTLRDTAYRASISLAMEKGAFPLFDEKYLESEFAKTLPDDIRADIRAYGIRNSHLLSIAPTGTISLGANNVSSGIEPVFSYEYSRDVRTFDGTTTEKVTDWAYREHGVKGKTTDDVTVQEHVDVLNLASYYVDSACSKTCNVGGNVNFKDFKQVYIDAYEGGASGCTTFRIDGKRFGMMRTEEHEPQEEVNDTEVIDGAACYIDPDTGIRSCE